MVESYFKLCLSVTSATAYSNLVLGEMDLMTSTDGWRRFSRRLMMPMPDALALVKYLAIKAPIPVPPPVMLLVQYIIFKL